MARKKKELKAKEPIKLRFKKLSNGNKSIYLDCYYNGSRSYEMLKMYLVPEETIDAKTQNKNTLQAANAIKAQRLQDLYNGEAGLKKSNNAEKMLLLDWLDVYIQKKREQGRSNKNAQNLISLRNHIVTYKGEKQRLCDVTKEWCMGFIAYLNKAKAMNCDKPLSKTTADMYFTKLSCVLEGAVNENLIEVNPIKKIASEDKKAIKPGGTTREYLTREEVQRLINTDCKNIEIKRAFLFACFCGLRISDIREMLWGDIHTDSNGQIVLEKQMQKTGKMLYLPLNESAIKWMPKRGEQADTDKVFPSLPTYNTVAYTVKAWAKEANIKKDICFHVSRHTFATLSLTFGADIYTTSKLLGHSKVSTTQIYAEIIDKKKSEAVNLFNGKFEL